MFQRLFNSTFTANYVPDQVSPFLEEPRQFKSFSCSAKEENKTKKVNQTNHYASQRKLWIYVLCLHTMINISGISSQIRATSSREPLTRSPLLGKSPWQTFSHWWSIGRLCIWLRPCSVLFFGWPYCVGVFCFTLNGVMFHVSSRVTVLFKWA